MNYQRYNRYLVNYYYLQEEVEKEEGFLVIAA